MSNSWISKAARLEIYKRDNMTCCYCGIQCVLYNDRTDNRSYATLDHVVSRVELAIAHQGIAYKLAVKDARNLVTVCNGCNCSKQEAPLYVWCNATGKDYYSIRAEIVRRTA